MAPHAATETTAITDTEGIPLPNPLTAKIPINDILNRRAKAQQAQWGVAAPTSMDAFRINRQQQQEHKPKAKRWDHYLSHETTSRTGSALKDAAKWLGTPGIISLGGGLPSSEYFPFASLSIKVPQAPFFSEAATAQSGTLLTAGKHDLAEGLSIFDIATAFNYGQGSGAAQLLRWISEHTELVHEPGYADWACTMTVGSTAALDMLLRMFTRAGDVVVSEEYTFASAVDTMRPLGVRVAGVAVDAEGMLPAALDGLLEAWDPAAHAGARKPRVLYTVPSGQNPTGATQSGARRAALYAVCRKHDVIVFEDEPYYFLQMDPYSAGAEADTPAAAPASLAEFLDALVPSYLHLDTDGRVVRLDSFSKVLAPGTRIGWITGSEQIVGLFRKHADLCTQGPSGVSQLMVFKLLDEHWGHGGYLAWLMHLRAEYTARRNVILQAAEQHLPREVVQWTPPMAGMFFWMGLDWKRHPDAASKSVMEIEEQVFMRSIEHGVLVMRGSWFRADADSEMTSLFFRATFAAAPFDKIQEAIRRFGEAIRVEFGLVQTA
ncbi:PLP-dependent transferase [Pseudovirgaria hyperparasitica]|uniref:aromatic-amino-acid transaminase n=1 Tax=Pseudovirgaria hyperparasitica TaxID=470096 RepID=A0A6A6VUP9_9PEZI|nr:PLP-dependent transferase [Pseudovirgaria hyperparasitica]KAF2754292.1 PLP-dependent transferase [Pseudovirgaria hyperparasitica]